MSSKIKALFIDRDGTIIKEKPGVYLCDPKKVELYKNTKAAFKLFKELGYTIFIVSNQSGIGRGYFTEREVKA
ncbi:MAG: HAD-IIIA family hydrolase, partial [Campylobacter sp.]|nr:HAD-IIIA family hydrolase [Campylobacter sp.]